MRANSKEKSNSTAVAMKPRITPIKRPTGIKLASQQSSNSTIEDSEARKIEKNIEEMRKSLKTGARSQKKKPLDEKKPGLRLKGATLKELVGEETSEFRMLLREAQCESLKATLEENGFNDLETLLECTEEHLIQIGISQKDQRERILSACSRRKKPFGGSSSQLSTNHSNIEEPEEEQKASKELWPKSQEPKTQNVEIQKDLATEDYGAPEKPKSFCCWQCLKRITSDRLAINTDLVFCSLACMESYRGENYVRFKEASWSCIEFLGV